MRTMRCSRRLVSYWVAVVAATAAITACSVTGDGRLPLTNGGGLSIGWREADVGEVSDFPVIVQNTGSVPIILVDVRLIPLPGFPIPRLAKVGVLTEHHTLLTSALGWPIRRLPPLSGFWQTVPIQGYVVRPWNVIHKHDPWPDMIEVGAIGGRPGTSYVFAGLSVTYKLNGHSYTQRLYEAGDDCVVPAKLLARTRTTAYVVADKQCAAEENRANKVLERIAP